MGLSIKSKSLLFDHMIDLLEREQINAVFNHAEDYGHVRKSDFTKDELSGEELDRTFIAHDDEYLKKYANGHRNCNGHHSPSKRNEASRISHPSTPLQHGRHKSSNGARKKRKGLINTDSELKDSFERSTEIFEEVSSPDITSPRVGRRESMKVDAMLTEHMHYSPRIMSAEASPADSGDTSRDHNKSVIDLSADDDSDTDTEDSILSSPEHVLDTATSPLRSRAHTTSSAVVIPSQSRTDSSGCGIGKTSAASKTANVGTPPPKLPPHLQGQARMQKTSKIHSPRHTQGISRDVRNRSSGVSASSLLTPILPVKKSKKRKCNPIATFGLVKNKKPRVQSPDDEEVTFLSTSNDSPQQAGSPSSTRPSPAKVSLAETSKTSSSRVNNDSVEEDRSRMLKNHVPKRKKKWKEARCKEKKFNPKHFHRFSPTKLRVGLCIRALEKLKEVDPSMVPTEHYEFLTGHWQEYFEEKRMKIAEEAAILILRKEDRGTKFETQFRTLDRELENILQALQLISVVRRNFVQQGPMGENDRNLKVISFKNEFDKESVDCHWEKKQKEWLSNIDDDRELSLRENLLSGVKNGLKSWAEAQHIEEIANGLKVTAFLASMSGVHE